nr:hypothetical protein B0A51_05812 [Rachicladosporium sp. CCFEE 5018]
MSYDRGQRNRRPLYAPPPPSSGRQHSAFGYWVPLITISSIALGGLAAWVWSIRDNEDDYHHDKPSRPSQGPAQGPSNQGPPQPYGGPPPQAGQNMPPYGGPLPSQSAGPQGGPPPAGGEASSYYSASEMQSRSVQQQQQQPDDGTFFGQVKGAMRRTPSPQQFFDTASRQVGAAAAAAGSALGRIMEEDKDEYYVQGQGQRRERKEEREGFSDHERWSEEAEEKMHVGPVEIESGKRAGVARTARDAQGRASGKKSVAIVVSADLDNDGHDDNEADYRTEHASILSHLPSAHDPSTTDLYVLIYSPSLKTLPPLDYQPSKTHSNLGSSYSAISTPAVTPGSELASISPRISPKDQADAPSSAFDALYTQAQTLVSSPSQILPFTTPAGYIQILKHLAPQIVYISDTLSGRQGETVGQLKGWVGHTILVAGDGGFAGLVDTETEDEAGREEKRWYERSQMVGLGKDIEVVDVGRVGDDWVRRIGGRE